MKKFAIAFALCSALSTGALAEIRYAVSGVETADGYADRIYDINESGVMTGSFAVVGGTEMFSFNGSVVSRLGNGGTGSGSGMTINNAGVIGGSFGTGIDTQPIIYDSGAFIDLSVSAPQTRGTGVRDINDNGAAALYGFNVVIGPSGAKFVIKSFGVDGASILDFPSIGTGALMFAISDEGVYGGASLNIPPDGIRPVLYDGALQYLPNFGGSYLSAIYDFNAAGNATGLFSTSNGPNAFFYNGTTIVDLGNLLSDSGSYVHNARTPVVSSGLSINNLGTIVGESVYDGGGMAVGDVHAFIHENGAMKDLNSLIDPASGWVLQSAWSINDSGQIVGYGTYKGQTRGFILNPLAAVPEPASWAMMIGGFALVGAGMRRRTSIRFAIA